MLDTISTFLDNLVWSEWALIIILVLILGVAIFGEDEQSLDQNGLPIEEPTIKNTDIITCSVPGQNKIMLNPTQYRSYSIDSYDGFVEIELLNGNLCYVPSIYTTIIDKSFKSVSEKSPV